MLEIQAEDEEIHATIERVNLARSWADRFDAASIETKRMILGHIIEKVTVGSNYRIHIDFKLSYKEFLGALAG